ncbi:MAG: DUF2089 domain-containing protein [Candidatus Promineifilaceae bacterium]
MNPVLGVCPVCGESLTITRLHCRNCDTSLEGHFTLGRLYHLSAEQLRFVETFLLCEGKINRVEKELDLSYPAVRGRLTDVIRALGFDVDEPERGVSPDERKEILRKLSQGELKAEEAVELLNG